MTRTPSWSGPLDRLAAIASVVFVCDFSTKQWALHRFSPDAASVSSGWHLAVVNNTHLGWGLGSTQTALPLTFALTAVIAALVLRICRPLTDVDPSAPMMLGLLAGAGAANLADALIPPHGVVDFIAFTTPAGTTTSFNVADVALAVGLALSVRSIWRIAFTMRGRSFSQSQRRTSSRSGAFLMRHRLLVSGGHALLAMCAFIWLYSMAIAWTPDAGRSAPNSLLCGVAVFALAFLGSQLRMRVLGQRAPALDEMLASSRTSERVVLDGSVPAFASDDSPSRWPGDTARAPVREPRERPRVDDGPAA